jgi:hypothetical protein
MDEKDQAEPSEALWDDRQPKDTWRNYSSTGRLAILLAGATFLLLFIPFEARPWGLTVATLAAYSVLVFSLAFRDKNCSLRRPQVQEQFGKFALMHGPFLLLVYAIEAGWLKLASHIAH